MNRLALRMTLAAAGLSAVAACLIVPGGIEAMRLHAAQDDPVRLSEIALERRFNADTASREIEAALAQGDADLAQSFVELADARAVAVAAPLRQRVEAASSQAAATVRTAGNFVKGFIGGEPDDLASLAGTVTGDLFVFGDIRDVARETTRMARGEAVDELVLGLACVGLAITAGTYATLGAGAPARVGVSVVKAASKTGRISARMGEVLARSLRETVDAGMMRRAVSGGAVLQPAVMVRGMREAVKVEKAQGLFRLAGDLGQVQAKAGTRAALDGLKLSDAPKDVAKVARLAEANGGKTRAILKVLGRGAIVLGLGTFNLASWMFWALLSALGLVVSIKRSVEHLALGVIRRRKAAAARRLAEAAPAV